MKHAIDLWSWEGRVSRRQVLVVGVILLAIKYGIDLAIATAFGVGWHPLVYLSPRLSPFLHDGLPRNFWVAMIGASLPFMAAGVSLSARRLRDMGVHPFWAGLFFLPFLHFAFFLVLCVVPSAPDDAVAEVPDAGPYRTAGQRLKLPPPLRRILPPTVAGALLFGLLASLAMALTAYIICTQISRSLGTGLFIGVPFGMSFITSYAVASTGRVKRRVAVLYGLIPQLLALIVVIALGWEGAACLTMASPLILAVGAGAGLVGYLTSGAPGTPILFLATLLAPLLVGVDLVQPPGAAPLAVVSEVRIAAPADVVWRNVVSFPPIAAAPSPVFALVAMPIEARIDGEGTGAMRRCVFTNGVFEEPIETWQPGRELTFGVKSQPPGLEHHIDVTRGQFLLTDNGDGTTTLRGTTWYDLHVFPTVYWKQWTDRFLHAIHLRVLDHIKHLSEHPAEAVASASGQPQWMATLNETCTCTRHGQEPGAR